MTTDGGALSAPSSDPVALPRAASCALTVRALSAAICGGDEADRSEVEKARRELDRLVRAGIANQYTGAAGGSGGEQQARYRTSP
ncbi:hypothetical protein [Streptomyces cavernicola]|uniref:Uncharacterized protein n=1 Tax=Streptomyces cavernicola TaxID=3043613 RepID=A0ABT6S692_9ACTN|nr:hypothetical protein [Streptomyces sp. B-S-A6]MDI3402851.1 hypothetical protein [Streptomyces sp. B-S-A6]